MSYHLQAALARERHNTMLAEAEAFRLAKQARMHRAVTQNSNRPIRRRWPRWVLLHRAAPSTETPR